MTEPEITLYMRLETMSTRSLGGVTYGSFIPFHPSRLVVALTPHRYWRFLPSGKAAKL